MKKLLALMFAVSLIADTPDTAVVVSTQSVTKVVSTEPRQIVINLSRVDATPTFQIEYETVTRIDGAVVSFSPFRSKAMTWEEVTSTIPAMVLSLEQFKAAAKASMTNTP